MKQKMIVLFCLFTLFFLLLGCTEMTRSEKNLCIKLASKSYAFLPNCTTENSCFDEVGELFKTKLNYNDESYLYEIQNHVARSWYFYNESLKEQKLIVKYCNNSDGVNAAGSINQAQFLISESFYELDQAMKKSFILIAKKENELTNKEIDQIKEEKIYLDLIELRQILSELDSGATNSDTYTSYYSKKANDFAKSSASKGFEIIVEKTPFWIEHFDTINNTILKEIGIKNQANFPFMEDIIPYLIYQAETLFYKKQSLLALQNFPIYEFMKLYSDLGGNKNSALKRFADLINRISVNENELNDKIENLWKITEKNILIANELILKEKEINEFSKISEKLILQTINLNKNSNESLIKIKEEYLTLKEKKTLSNLSKGEELKKLNFFDEELNKLIIDLKFNQNGFEEKLIKACKEEAKKKEYENNYESNEINQLIQDIQFFSSRVTNTNGRECLLACTELMEKKEILNIALKNYALFESQKKDSAKNCLAFLEKIFQYEQINEQKFLFEELKKTQINKDNLEEFNIKCNLIQEKVKKYLSEETTYKNILQEYLNSKKNLLQLEKIYFYSNQKETLTQINSYENKLKSFEEYFNEKEILFEKIASLKETILEKLMKINQELNKIVKEKTIEFIQETIIIKKINQSIIILNEPNYSEHLLIIENPFEEIVEEIYLKINTQINSFQTAHECIDYVKNDLIKINCLPKGKITANFFEETTYTSIEKDVIKHASNELSLLKRTINIEPKIQTNKLLIKTPEPKNTSLTNVLIDSKEILFSNENNYTTFLVENLNEKTIIEVDYYLKNLIIISKELIEVKNTDLDETLIYSLSAKNDFSEKINATLIIPFPSTSAEITIYSADYTKKEIKKVGEKIILQNQIFEAKETKYYEIWVKTSNALDYYSEGLEKQASFFEMHNLTEEQETTKKAIESNNLDLMKKIFESNVEKINRIELNEKEKTELILMKQKLLDKIEELRKKQEELVLMGLISQSEKIGTTIDSILNEKMNTEKDIAKSFDTLVNLVYSTDNKIKGEVEKMWSKIIETVEDDEELNKIKNSFFDLKIEFEEIFYVDALKANKLFVELTETHDLFFTTLKEVQKTRNNEQKNYEKKIEDILNYCDETLTYFEEKLLQNNSELLKSKFITPLTQTRIEKIKLLLNEIKNSNEYPSEKLKKLEPLFDELWVANENIKRQAINSFNNAVDKKSSKEVLEQSKKLIDQNNFIDAYLFLQTPNMVDLNLFGFSAFLPILIIIISAIILKNKYSKKEKEESERKKIISEEWEKI